MTGETDLEARIERIEDELGIDTTDEYINVDGATVHESSLRIYDAEDVMDGALSDHCITSDEIKNARGGGSWRFDSYESREVPDAVEQTYGWFWSDIDDEILDEYYVGVSDDDDEHPLEDAFDGYNDSLTYVGDKPAVESGHGFLTKREMENVYDAGYRVTSVEDSVDYHGEHDNLLVVFTEIDE
jgi:hypothetical protein